MIAADQLSHSFNGISVLDGVTITVPDQGMVGLVGPNGSGKTTILRAMYSALSPDSGRVTVDGTGISDIPRRSIAKKLAVVVQEHASDLPVTVAELAMLGRLPHQRMLAGVTQEDRRIVAEALERVGVLHLAEREFSQLSGGERQRVLIARALVQEASHILLDEPTNHLDIRYQHEVLALAAELPASVVVVLHDLNLAAAYCDHVVVLDAGRVVAQGSPNAVFTPELLEPVYKVQVRRLDMGEEVHLMFRTRSAEHSGVSAEDRRPAS